MKILFTSLIPEGYVVQTYGALMRGLSEMFEMRVPTAEERASCRTYKELCQKTFQQDDVDVIFVEPILIDGRYKDPFEGASESRAIRVMFLSDFWYFFGPALEEFIDYIDRSGVTYLLTLYPLAFDIYKGTSIESKLRWLPPTFDPKRFNDWGLPKEFDVGFIGSGVVGPDPFYPERYAMHSALVQSKRWYYYTREHAGYGKVYGEDDPLVGRGYSREINRCWSFLASGGRPNLGLARHFETMASGALVFSPTPIGAAQLGLVDGETFVSVTPDTLLEKMELYFSKPSEVDRIRRNGYRLAMEKHTCFQRALDFHAIIERNGGRP